MSTTVFATEVRATAAPQARGLHRLAALPLVLGIFCSFWGLAYDIQWHSEVGPDTFFTLPHLFLYSGVALAGLTALLVVLYSTYTYRAGRSAFAVAQLTSLWGGRFWAPIGFMIAGFGSLAFLLFGLYDEWWHSLYGFDVTILSPPHIGLFSSILINMVGCIALFTGMRNRATGRLTPGAMLGLAITVAILLGTLVIFIGLLALLPLLPNPHELGMALAFAITLLMVASSTRQPGVATLTALIFTGLRTLVWFLAPWATARYAASLGLYLRDYATGVSEVASAMPKWALVAAVAVDLAFWLGRRYHWSLFWVVALAGGASALLLVWPQQYLPADFAPLAAITPVLAAVLGAAAGWIGWKLGIVLRKTTGPRSDL